MEKPIYTRKSVRCNRSHSVFVPERSNNSVFVPERSNNFTSKTIPILHNATPRSDRLSRSASCAQSRKYADKDKYTNIDKYDKYADKYGDQAGQHRLPHPRNGKDTYASKRRKYDLPVKYEQDSTVPDHFKLPRLIGTRTCDGFSIHNEPLLESYSSSTSNNSAELLDAVNNRINSSRFYGRRSSQVNLKHSKSLAYPNRASLRHGSFRNSLHFKKRYQYGFKLQPSSLQSCDLILQTESNAKPSSYVEFHPVSEEDVVKDKIRIPRGSLRHRVIHSSFKNPLKKDSNLSSYKSSIRRLKSDRIPASTEKVRRLSFSKRRLQQATINYSSEEESSSLSVSEFEIERPPLIEVYEASPNKSYVPDFSEDNITSDDGLYEPDLSQAPELPTNPLCPPTSPNYTSLVRLQPPEGGAPKELPMINDKLFPRDAAWTDDGYGIANPLGPPHSKGYDSNGPHLQVRFRLLRCYIFIA